MLQDRIPQNHNINVHSTPPSSGKSTNVSNYDYDQGNSRNTNSRRIYLQASSPFESTHRESAKLLMPSKASPE